MSDHRIDEAAASVFEASAVTQYMTALPQLARRMKELGLHFATFGILLNCVVPSSRYSNTTQI